MRFVAYSMTAAVLMGGLSFAGGAYAQTGTTTNHRATPSVVNCPPGCTPTASCVQATVLTPAQRRRLAERRKRLQEEHARADQARIDQARAEQRYLDSLQLEREMAARDAQLDLERANRARAESDLLAAQADRDRIDRERLALLNRPVARGGGPVEHYRPRIMLGLEGGAGGYTNGMNNAVYPGPSWGARVGVMFTDWLMIEGRYVGMWNDGRNNAVGPGVGVTTNGGFGALRLTLPTRFVQPYIFGGIGGYQMNLTGSAAAQQASGLINGHQSVAMPLGGGLDVPIGRHFGVAVEGMWQYLFNDNGHSQVPMYDEGHLWNTSLLLHVNL